MARVHNFNAGPAALPLPVLERAQRELCDFQGTGMSIMEHSHRGGAYDAVHAEAIDGLRELLDIPDGYQVLFLPGGASLQFAMVPMNLIHDGLSADYVVTGTWAQKALAEADRVRKARAAADMHQDGKCTRIPKQSELDLDPAAAYVHITSNNTIFGTQWHHWPEVGSAELICDMSSDLLWRPIDVRRFGLIYAGAQKNIGPSGLCVAIMKQSLIDSARTDVPIILRYGTHAKENSLYNTPNTFAIYMVRNVVQHLLETGGLSAMEAKNRAKAELLYGAIDADPDFFRAPVAVDSRSTMNVVFNLPSEALEKRFVNEATDKGMVGLKGHRSTGGIRVSTYNAVELASLQALVDFMTAFRKTA